MDYSQPVMGSIWAGIRRLHRTDIQLEHLGDALARWSLALKSRFIALFPEILPKLLFQDHEQLVLHLRSAEAGQMAFVRNLRPVRTLEFDQSTQETAITSLLPLFNRGQGPIASLLVMDNCLLRTTVRIPSGIRTWNLRHTLRYLLEVETPFHRDELYWTFRRVRASGSSSHQEIELIAVPKSIVNASSATLAKHQVHLGELLAADIDTRDGTRRIAHFPTDSYRHHRRIVFSLLATIALLLAAIGTIPFLSIQRQISLLAEETQRLSQVAADLGRLQAAVSTELAPITTAYEELATAPRGSTVVQLLESELGPDVVLDRLSIRGTSIQATGITDDFDRMATRIERSSRLEVRSLSRTGGTTPGHSQPFSLTLELTAGSY